MTRGSEFLLDAPADLQGYFREIAARMVLTFDLPRAEAVARINRHWRGQTFDKRNDLVLHAPPDYWALVIYFEEVFEDGQLRRVARPAPPPDSQCWTLS
jgi:hypothetical protein